MTFSAGSQLVLTDWKKTLLYEKNFPVDGQSRWVELLSSQLFNLPSAEVPAFNCNQLLCFFTFLSFYWP